MSTNYLPLDILHFILLKLPVKSLLRFKVVDKSWNAIISDHDFAKKHLLQSKKYSRNQNSLLWRPLPMDVDHKDYILVNFENNKFQVEAIARHPYPGNLLCYADDGLLLLSTSSLTSFMLWNPSRKQQKIISCPDRFGSFTTAFGFCRSPNLDDYKIVARGGGYYAVFSCKNKVWTKEKKFPYDNRHVYRRVVFVDGFSFWVMREPVSCTFEILYFDPKYKKFKKLHKPRNLDGKDYFQLTILNSCLCLYKNDVLGALEQLQIWIMRDPVDVDSTSWTKLMIIDKGCLHGMVQSYTWITPLFLTEKNELVMHITYYQKRMFGIYNSTEKKYENIDVPASMIIERCSEIVPYIDSLFFPIR